MTTREFKNIVNRLLADNSFVKKGGRYYLRSPEIICIIGLQKSDYSTRYYLNVGYLISQLEPELDLPGENDGHVRTRMIFRDTSGKEVDYIDLDELNGKNPQQIEHDITENILKLTTALSLNGLKTLLKYNPIMLYQTTVKAKTLLGYN